MASEPPLFSPAIVRRVVPLTMAWERLAKSISVHGDDSGALLVEPVPAIALDSRRARYAAL